MKWTINNNGKRQMGGIRRCKKWEGRNNGGKEGDQKARKSERRRRKIKLRSLRSIGNMRQLMGQNMNWDQQWEFIIYTQSVTDREESHI